MDEGFCPCFGLVLVLRGGGTKEKKAVPPSHFESQDEWKLRMVLGSDRSSDHSASLCSVQGVIDESSGEKRMMLVGSG
jgi:hypothetical protein